jgi:membrane fusion protein (multidrug efflux system)
MSDENKSTRNHVTARAANGREDTASDTEASNDVSENVTRSEDDSDASKKDQQSSAKTDVGQSTESKAPPQEKAAKETAAKPEITGTPSAIQRFGVPFVILLLAGGILFFITHNWNAWTGAQKIQTTDDAFLRADITPLSTRISGTVLKVAVEDYQSVKAGDLLVLIKDDDYRAQVEQAEAIVQAAQVALENNRAQKGLQDTRIAQARTSIEAARADIAETEANIQSAKADLANSLANTDATRADVERTQLERKRQESLLAAAATTKQRLEQVVADEERFRALLASREAEREKVRALMALRQADLDKAKSALVSKEQELVAQQKQRGLLDVQEDQLKADVAAKEASLKVVRTNLEYTRIVAPTDGIVGERKVREGQLVSPGMQVLSLVQGTIWIQANYKETQLTNVRKGDTAEATVDAFPGVVLRGRVEEIAPASGSQFALLPPDNASGNFTKVAQRVPVKIILDVNSALAERLRPGMSVIAEIKTTGGNKD